MTKNDAHLPADLRAHLPAAHAISKLLFPYGEIVLHDLRTKKISKILNSFSKRTAGDPSLLEEELDLKNLPDFFGPYTKINYDGKRLKSVSSTIRDDNGEAVGLFCINFDVSRLESLSKEIVDFTEGQEGEALPTELFSEDWKEKINSYVKNYLKEHQLSRNRLDRKEKKRLIRQLEKDGAFKAKDAAHHIGLVIGISRATVYNLLREGR